MNIFGGIMRNDIIADGIVAAVKEVGLKVPLVVRLEGTNVEEGKKIIRESGLNVIPADNLSDAAEKDRESGQRLMRGAVAALLIGLAVAGCTETVDPAGVTATTAATFQTVEIRPKRRSAEAYGRVYPR